MSTNILNKRRVYFCCQILPEFCFEMDLWGAVIREGAVILGEALIWKDTACKCILLYYNN